MFGLRLSDRETLFSCFCLEQGPLTFAPVHLRSVWGRGGCRMNADAVGKRILDLNNVLFSPYYIVCIVVDCFEAFN